MKKIRVAILADFPMDSLLQGATGRGGGQGCTWLPQLADSFSGMEDLEIHWIVLDRDKSKSSSAKQINQTFHTVSTTRFSIDLLLGCWPSRLAIKRVLKRVKPDIIHAWGTERIYPSALQDWRGLSILSMQGVLTSYEKIGGLGEDWRWRKMVASEPNYIKAATIVTSESAWGVEQVRRIAGNVDCRMVEYGVHPGFFDIKWNPDPEVPYVLYVGGSGYRKGFDLLLDAMKLLPDRRWELRLAGGNDMERLCREASLTRYRCLGMLAWEEMKRELASAWCTVLPTRGDTSPNSVKEARVVGVPVVTTKFGGQSGYIVDGENGRIVDPLSAENLAEALRITMRSHETVCAMGRARHDMDRAYLSSEKTARAFREIYLELAQKLPSGQER
jgi:glycosyltransferase involved in cell wall biosynthesis